MQNRELYATREEVSTAMKELATALTQTQAQVSAALTHLLTLTERVLALEKAVKELGEWREFHDKKHLGGH